jgi:hypothetical protein
VREHNIYRWAGTLIAELAAIRLSTQASPAAIPAKAELVSLGARM